MSSVGKKCGDISMVMADAYYFIKLRTFVEQMQEKADQGDFTAGQFMERFETFHRLCQHILGELDVKG